MDIINIRMRDHFDCDFLGDGERGLRFRITEIEPKLSLGYSLVVDFDGVRNMTDSFSNACFAQLFFTHGELMGSRIKFANCSPVIRSFIMSAAATAHRMAGKR